MLSNVITKSREVTLLGDKNVDYLRKNDNLGIKNVFSKLLPNQQELQNTQKR